MDNCVSDDCGFAIIGEKLVIFLITFYNKENLQFFSYVSIYENLFNAIGLLLFSKDRH